MSVSFVAVQESQDHNSTGLGSYIPSSLGLAVGDLLLGFTIADAAVTVSVTNFAPTPWTTLADVTQGGARFGMYTRVVTADDLAAVGSANSWSASASSHSNVVLLLAYRDATIDAQSYQTASGSSTPTAPSLTATRSSLLVCRWGEQVGAVGSLSLPGGFTQRGTSMASNGSFFNQNDTESIAGEKVVSAGATGTQASSSSGGTGDVIGWSVLLGPVAVAQAMIDEIG